MKKTIILLSLFAVQVSLFAQEYFPEGTKWTEIRLDTLKYDSWYSKVDGEWVPNFETIEYRVLGIYSNFSETFGDNSLKCVYTNCSEWTDSLSLLIVEGKINEYLNYGRRVMATVPIYFDCWDVPSPAMAYNFDWRVGMPISFIDILSTTYDHNSETAVFGIIEEINEGNFGGVRPLSYTDVNGVRFIQGIGVTTWNDGECIFGPVKPYEALSAYGAIEPEERHYRSMLVHFERNGEVLYDVWPRKGSAVEVAIDGLNYFLYLDRHEAVLTSRNNCSGEVDIPSEVRYNDETFVVKSMTHTAFHNNSELTKVRIPKTIEEIIHYYPVDPDWLDPPTGMANPIYVNPFKGCIALESIEVDEENPCLKSIDGVLFSQDGVGQYYYKTGSYSGTGLYCYPEGARQESYTIPESVEWIGGAAFPNNQYLTTLTIPNSMKHICYDAFSGCSNLTDVYCYAENAPIAWDGAFRNVPIASATLHVPAGSIEEYKTTSPWSEFGNIVGIAQEGPIKDISRYFSYFIVTPESQYETMNLWYQRKKYVAADGKEYLQYGGYFREDSIVDAMVLLRQEEAKCFCYDTNTDTEHLLFDLGLQKGDSYYDDFNNIEYEVTDVRDTIVNNESLCLIELMSQDGRHDIWLEGCGSIYTGILKANASCEDVCLLRAGEIRFYPNNQFVKTADANVTQLVWEGKLETPEDWEAYEVWYGAPSDLNAEFVDDTLHVWGRLHTYCDIIPYAICGLREDQIDFMLYSNGDVDCYNNYEIDVRIPGFQRGSYEVQLHNKTVRLECMGAVEPIIFTEGQMATIVLPTEPEAGKGKYYRLDRVEGNEIIFEQELQPRARVPYIIVPGEDFCIDLSTLNLQGLQNDTVSIEVTFDGQAESQSIYFIGSYVNEELEQQEGCNIQFIDTTPDCSISFSEETGKETFLIGALRAYLTWDDPIDHGGAKGRGDMEIVLRDYGTDIKTHSNSPLKGENKYDLSGRKIVNGKWHGIYIENGQKRAK